MEDLQRTAIRTITKIFEVFREFENSTRVIAKRRVGDPRDGQRKYGTMNCSPCDR
jgi:hypothetical protein